MNLQAADISNLPKIFAVSSGRKGDSEEKYKA
jgi:hypothetical protein